MSAEKDDELKSFQIGLRSGTGSVSKKAPSEHFEITREDYPNLSAANRIKATFKRKTGEKLQDFKNTMKNEEKSSDEKEAAEKAKRAWELALEVVSQLSVKD